MRPNSGRSTVLLIGDPPRERLPVDWLQCQVHHPPLPSFSSLTCYLLCPLVFLRANQLLHPSTCLSDLPPNSSTLVQSLLALLDIELNSGIGEWEYQSRPFLLQLVGGYSVADASASFCKEICYY